MSTQSFAIAANLRRVMASARTVLLGVIAAIAIALPTSLRADHGCSSWRVAPLGERSAPRVGLAPRAFLPAPGLTRVQGRDIGANAAATAVRSATGGKVLRVRRLTQGTSVVYLVKVLLPGGKIRTVSVDGASGALR